MARAAGDAVERRAGAVERSMRALAPLAAGRRASGEDARASGRSGKPTALARAPPADRRALRLGDRAAHGRPGARAGAPVVCVGNFVAGGAGKTPAAIALAQMLIADGRRVAFLSRGYGGAKRVEPVRVDPNVRRRAAWSATSRCCSPGSRRCWVGADRVQSARGWRSRRGRTSLMLDDGLQNPALAKDLAFAVVDGEQRFGNGLCVPAGPLRAPVAAQARASCRR